MTIYNDYQKEIGEIVKITPVTLTDVNIITKEIIINVPKYVEKEQEKYITKEMPTTRYVEEIESTIRYIPKEMPTIRYQEQIVNYDMPDVEQIKKDLLTFKSEVCKEINEMIDQVKLNMKTLLTSIPDQIKIPRIVEESYIVQTPKFIPVEVQNCRIVEKIVEVIKPKFIEKNFDVIGKIVVRESK